MIANKELCEPFEVNTEIYSAFKNNPGIPEGIFGICSAYNQSVKKKYDFLFSPKQTQKDAIMQMIS